MLFRNKRNQTRALTLLAVVAVLALLLVNESWSGHSQELFRAALSGEPGKVRELLIRRPLLLLFYPTATRRATALREQLREALMHRDAGRVDSMLAQTPELVSARDVVLTRGCGGNTLLHLTAGIERMDGDAIAQVLLKRGADVNAKNYDEMTPLHIAATSGSVKTVSSLLTHQALIDPQDMDGNTPLLFAAVGSEEKVVRLLLAAGANPNVTNNSKVTPLTFAGNEEIRAILKQASEERNAKLGVKTTTPQPGR
jgi:ankyrin repeat protein